jgi:hypothetical protein
MVDVILLVVVAAGGMAAVIAELYIGGRRARHRNHRS